MNVDEIFFAFMSLFSVLILVGVHIHIKNKLGARHDNGLLFAAGAMSAWLLMAIWEWYGKIHFPTYNLEVRKFISIINTGLFFSSLIYFKDSWYKVNKNLEKIQYHIIAIISTVLLLIAYVIIPQTDDWSYFEGWVSILVAVLLSSSMSVTLYFREDESQDKKMSLLFFVPIISGILLISAQIFDDGFIKYSNFDPIDNKNFYLAFRMLSRPMLIISYLLVAMTWLQKKQDEINFFESVEHLFNRPTEPSNQNEPTNKSETFEVTDDEINSNTSIDAIQEDVVILVPNPDNQPDAVTQPLINRLIFSDTDMKIGITFHSEGNIYFSNALIRFGLSKAPYKLLKECAQKMKEFGAFRLYPPSSTEKLKEEEREYEGNKVVKGLNDSSNAHKDLGEVIKLLNSGKFIKPYGRNVLPDIPIVFQTFFISTENNGEYRLPFAPENIVFDTRSE